MPDATPLGRNLIAVLSTAIFHDLYGRECNISKSSIVNQDCIWLGQHRARMHLTQKRAGELAQTLQHFAETGDLPYQPK